MPEYAMPSSGDDDADRAALEAFKQRQLLLAEGLCPNVQQHGPVALEQIASNVRECPKCGFTHTSIPISAE
jgi:Zn ribbon nucleic-acid-binding protein